MTEVVKMMMSLAKVEVFLTLNCVKGIYTPHFFQENSSPLVSVSPNLTDSWWTLLILSSVIVSVH